MDYERGLVQVGERTLRLPPTGRELGLVERRARRRRQRGGPHRHVLRPREHPRAPRRGPHASPTCPIRKVVNTHHNGDHCWGNQLVEGATVIGHHRCRAEMLTGASPGAARRARRRTPDDGNGAVGYLKKAFAPFDFSGIEIVAPTVTFEDRLWLHPGGTSVRLEYFGPCHTLGDIVAWRPGRTRALRRRHRVHRIDAARVGGVAPQLDRDRRSASSR